MASPSQSMPSQVRPSRIASIAALVERSRSVSSIRSSILPPRLRAYSQLNSAVRAPPMWRKPVGEGAKRVTTVSDILEVGQGLRWVGARPLYHSLGLRSHANPGQANWNGEFAQGIRPWRVRADLAHRPHIRFRPRLYAGDGATRRRNRTSTAMTAVDTAVREAGQDFIRDIIKADLAAGRHKTVVTRFPPEPNGYLHIGHAKAICLNFGVAQEFGGRCHLRFDDTNPTKEEQEYIDAIEQDVRWLGFDWGCHLYHASDYFEQLYAWAEHLIRSGNAYVDDQSQEEMRASRGTLTEPGRNSPWRERSIEENLDLFRRMRAGEFPNGARVLRAKIDMASGNINLRDPVLYRILHASHPRTGTAWSIYPSYDFAHGQSDALEHITHSICTLEFEDHRPLYDWFLDNLKVPSRPRQYEVARLNLTYTILSKRVLTELVRGGHVQGWDDPRMPTLAGLRRRGVPPQALRDFVKRIGVAKANSVVDVAMLDFSVREVLNKSALRRMAVLRPLKVVIENYPEGQTEELDAVNHPDDPAAGSRKIRFGRELYIERDDFMEQPAKKFFRLGPGKEVRLRYAYFVTCREVVKNNAGEVTELRCSYDPGTRGGNAPDGRKVQATLHWVAAAASVPAEIRLYHPLFARPDPNAANF